ncbi:Oxidoreductase family protein [Striga hermonthica]|uniref:Oxidoreductase family protein n=1 Tax=Striga hermonthica TaxID=68872 RepID=A0A9N7R0Z8_STRHE|nr:Oxidoreductase family protein [Striga hermonthica]
MLDIVLSTLLETIPIGVHLGQRLQFLSPHLFTPRSGFYSSAGNPTTTRKPSAGPNRSVNHVRMTKYRIVGVGMMGREHLINLYHLKNEGVVVVAIADPHVPSQHQALNLANFHPTPHNVLVEKPLYTTATDCKKVIDAAAKRPDVLVQVGLEYRYMPSTAKLIDLVKDGVLGRVKMVSIREH